MKNFKLFSFLILLIFIRINLFTLDLVSQHKIQRINKKNYDKNSYYVFRYSIKDSTLFAILEDDSVTSISQKETKLKNFLGVFAFDKNGILISKIGNFNSYDYDGVIYVTIINLSQDNLFLRDIGKKMTTVFSIKKPFKYLYNIKSPINSFNLVYFIQDSIAFSLQPKDNFFNESNKKLDIKDYKRIAIGKIENTNIPNIKEVTSFKKIYSYKNFFDAFWNDKTLLTNKIIKRFLKKFNNFSKNYALSLVYPFMNIGASTNFSYIIPLEKKFFASYTYGTEFRLYSNNATIIDSFMIDKYQKLKRKEIKKYKQILMKKLKKKNQLKKFISKYEISKLTKMFYDKKNRNMLLFYQAKEPFLTIAGLPKANFYILVYSLDKRKAISDFIPIDFTPVQFDSEKRELIGTQFLDSDIYLQFYKWEY